MPEAANRRPDSVASALVEAVWPAARVAEALRALAGRAGLPVSSPADAGSPPVDGSAQRLGAWIEAAADREGLQADPVYAALDEVDTVLAHAAPALVRVAAMEEAPFLAILGCRRRHVLALGPDLRVRRVLRSDVSAAIRRPFETPVEGEIDLVLDRMQLGGRSRARARTMMIADRLRSVRVRNCWLLRLPPGATAAHLAREAGLPGRIATLVLAHLAQYLLFILSWWWLGRAVLSGSFDRGWLLGWGLLLVSLVPLRLMATWNQGLAAVSVGAWLRRRLLRGAFRIDRQQLRQQGGGQLFGLVVEASAVDALALSGGIFAAFSVLELLVATVILCLGAGALPAVALAAWMGLVAFLTWRYFRQREAWTGERFRMTHHLLECMVGHRTRLVQQPPAARHEQEDESLDQYIGWSHAMDRASLWLTALVPRGWLVVGLATLTPTLVTGASAGRVAVSIGGILLAFRALQRLAAGLSNLTGAIIAGRAVAALADAARRDAPRALSPALALPRPHDAHSGNGVLALARDLTFRYRPQGDPVLQGCSLNIERHAHVLLEGPSGSGKTTFASVVAGLLPPESGLLLVDGLDQSAVGSAGWRTRVVMAPQAHDNYLVGASLAFNLLMGRRWPAERGDLAEAEAICRELGLGDLLDRLPGGLHQVVGETGWQLSQGERVRVFLARALLQQPDLLVLDESFSALDADNVDYAVRCVLHRAPTVLAIAHP